MGPPGRGGTVVEDGAGREAGRVTSGCPAPSLPGTNVAMAYVETALAKPGTKLQLRIRNKTVEATVTKMPFVPSNYYNL